MEFETARNLIAGGVPATDHKQTWCDLGAGAGFFTAALASLLPAHSMIYAIDRDLSGFNASKISGVEVVTIQGDFTVHKIIPSNLDGILLANSLHFVLEKSTFIERLQTRLRSTGRIIIVEYDMTQGNTWVPYPIGANHLRELLTTTGFDVAGLSTAKSLYGREIYSLLATPSLAKKK